MEGVLPSAEIAPLMREHFVGLAADADAPEEPVVALGMEHLSQATMLPFVMYVDADGTWLAGHAGAVSPPRLHEQLLDLVQP